MSVFVPTLFVADVEASSRWYQQLFGLTSGHGGPEFEMLMRGDDDVLHLHKEDAEEHGTMITPGAPKGSGVLLYFQVDDVDAVHAAHRRALDLGADVQLEPTFNPQAHHTEMVLRDPDGYALAINSPFDPS